MFVFASAYSVLLSSCAYEAGAILKTTMAARMISRHGTGRARKAACLSLPALVTRLSAGAATLARTGRGAARFVPSFAQCVANILVVLPRIPSLLDRRLEHLAVELPSHPLDNLALELLARAKMLPPRLVGLVFARFAL